MANTAFESITTRHSWKTAEVLAKYDAVMYDADGNYVKSDGTRPFVGIVQYGADTIGDFATVVRGTYPAIAQAIIATGALVTIDAAHPGKFITAVALDKVYGVALTEAGAAGEMFTLAMADVPHIV